MMTFLIFVCFGLLLFLCIWYKAAQGNSGVL